jgi:hypothetical protein
MQEVAQPMPEPHEVSRRAADMVDAERLMATVRSLPVKRAAQAMPSTPRGWRPPSDCWWTNSSPWA